MGQGGLISTSAAVTQLYQALGSRKKAQRAIADALVSQCLTAYGRMIQALHDVNPVSLPFLRDLNSMELEAVLARRAIIPPQYWLDLSWDDVARWDWNNGHLVNSAQNTERRYGFVNVMFVSKDINAITSRLAGTLPREPRASGPRLPGWHDWIAAAVVLATEGAITQNSTATDVSQLVAERLKRWGKPPVTNRVSAPITKNIADQLKLAAKPVA